MTDDKQEAAYLRAAAAVEQSYKRAVAASKQAYKQGQAGEPLSGDALMCSIATGSARNVFIDKHAQGLAARLESLELGHG